MGNKRLITVAFGRAIQELRHSRGFSQTRLAELAETERSHISAIERAEKGPSLATVFSLARALGITAGELIDFVDQKQNQEFPLDLTGIVK